MTVRARLRRLGVDGRPRVECPSCHGAGRTYDVDGRHQIWVFTERVERVRADRAGRRYEPTEPEPDEAQQACGWCRGVGVVSGATVTEWEREGVIGGRIVEERLAGIRRYFARYPSAPDTDTDGPATLRAVDD